MKVLKMLFGAPKPEFKERIWLTTERKMNDLVIQVRNSQMRGINSVVVTHFKTTQVSLIEALDRSGVSFQVITNSTQFPSNILDVLSQKGTTLVLASDAIPSFVTRAESSQPKNTTLAPMSVHLAEHYPCFDRDQKVLALDKVWPMRIEFTCYTGLDEPLLISFGADRIREMLLKLGIDKESVLEHPFLCRSIQSAQKRVAQQVPHEQICESCEEWVRRNLQRTIMGGNGTARKRAAR